jgi:hypothetical protein
VEFDMRNSWIWFGTDRKHIMGRLHVLVEHSDEDVVKGWPRVVDHCSSPHAARICVLAFILGGRVVYALEDLQEWVSAGAKQSTSDPGVGTVYPAKRISGNTQVHGVLPRRRA